MVNVLSRIWRINPSMQSVKGLNVPPAAYPIWEQDMREKNESQTPEFMMAHADRTLYQARQKGRDRIVKGEGLSSIPS